MTPNRREVLAALSALLLGLAAAIALTWPMLSHIDVVVLGGGELGGWLWRYDWHYQSLEALLASGQGPIDTWLNFVSLGRYPETGNILDVLVVSYPLDRLLGFPLSYNVKILAILALNGLCGYALARYFSGSISAALAASTIAVVNPLTQLEVQSCGLRQAVLWWVLLYPAVLDRALRRRSFASGAAAGITLGLAAAWYWFYGLFASIFTAIWIVKSVVSERRQLRITTLVRTLLGLGAGVAIAAGPFLLAYLVGDTDAGGISQNGGAAVAPLRLPEMTFFLPFPSYDTISQAPLRPQSYAENVLASINRTIGSSWSGSFAIDPRLNEALPLTVVALGVVPALNRRRAWPWLVVWLIFFLGALGPFLRVGTGDSRNVTRIAEDYVLRMPYTWMFQFIPGMSRMFAPYRLASFVVVASVVLVAMGVARLRFRAWVAPLVVLATTLQPLYRWGKGGVNEGDVNPSEFRSPIKANRIRVPDYYRALDASAFSGIVELPLDQQQDLIYYYQIIHKQKVFRSWASPGAIPAFTRGRDTGGVHGERMRYLARPDVVSGDVPRAFADLSTVPGAADLTNFTPETLARWAKSANYQRIIVHERGYYLVDPQRGGRLYGSAVERIATALNLTFNEEVEIRKGDPVNPEFGVPMVGDLVPWTSQPTDLPPERTPDAFRMAVFELPYNASETD
ncbi:MAG: hypothetical protein FJ090_14175 [Deltaproteobacteria bacterium]|nr:hypothetical protein [Deltaproteobacteria bacterium]